MDIISWIKNQGIEVKGPHYQEMKYDTYIDIYGIFIHNIHYEVYYYPDEFTYELRIGDMVYENDDIKEFLTSKMQPGP